MHYKYESVVISLYAITALPDINYGCENERKGHWSHI